ncbi:hypothetical protein VTG60DRAFT_2547 [Thermothelomyces hinnuleus]
MIVPDKPVTPSQQHPGRGGTPCHAESGHRALENFQANASLRQCDGQLPCRRCRSRGEECVYEDKKWRTKDHLRSEIERLRTEQRQGQALLRALTNNDPCRWRTLLDRMTAGDPPEAIAEWILARPSARLAGSLGRPPPLAFAVGQDDKPSRGGPDALITTPGPGLAENSRTSRHPGPCLVQRLLARFFGSSLPYLSIVSQRHFMNDFRQGNPRVSFGDAFLAEAKRLLAREEELPSLPYIQALGVLAVAEMTRGNEEVAGDLAREFARAGIRFLLQTRQQEHSHDDDFKTVRALAYCGGLSFVRTGSLLRLLTGDLEPKTGPLFMRIYPDFRDVEDDTPEARVERGISLQVQFFAQLQHCPPLARFIFEVTEAAHTFSSYNHSKAMTASDLEGAFGKCTGYYRQVAELSASDADGVGPDVLLARIWYNFCLLSLLQPFVANSASLVDGLPPSLTGHSTPYTVCRQSSEAIISLTSVYQSRHSLDYLPPLLPYMVFAAVLHQRSLAAPRLTAGEVTQEGVVLSPEPQSPDAVSDPSYSLSDRRQSISQPGACLGPAARPSMYGGEPPSPAVVAAMKTPSSNAPPSDTGQHSSLEHPNAQSGALPTFTSQPADLVALGSLQLVSMGAQHRGAAEASHLLRTSGSTLDMA